MIPHGHPKAESLNRGVALDLTQLTRPLNCVVELTTQPPNVLQQVTLRPDKVTSTGLIRLGETPGDEARCWIHHSQIHVIEILGNAVEIDAGKWEVEPLERAA